MNSKFLKSLLLFGKNLMISFIICIEIFLAFIISYLTIALIYMSIGTGRDQILKKGVTIYMKSDGIHTDFVFPVHVGNIDWTKLISPEDTRGKDSTLKFISIGWGDQGFFLNTPEWSDLKASTAFNACFYLSKTAVHANYMKDLNIPQKHVKLIISQKEYSLLYNYVKKTLEQGENIQTVCIKNRGYWETDSFYEANGSYGLFFTCNSWVNKGLNDAGLPACLWAPFNSGIFHKYN